MKACRIGGCPEKSTVNCPKCENWIPSRKSKYYRCLRFHMSKLLCGLPRKQCKTCQFYISKTKVGRPSNEDSVWKKDSDFKKKYMRDYMRAKRNGKPWDVNKWLEENVQKKIDPKYIQDLRRLTSELPLEGKPIALTVKGKPVEHSQPNIPIR